MGTIENFDYHGYSTRVLGLTDDPEESERYKVQIYQRAVSDLYKDKLKEAKQDPSLDTTGRRRFAINETLRFAEDGRSILGLREEVTDPEEPYQIEQLKTYLEETVDPAYHDTPIRGYMTGFSKEFINKNTEFERPLLQGLTREAFREIFYEKTNTSKDNTVADILGKEEVVDGVVEEPPESAWLFAIDQAQSLMGTGAKTAAEFLDWEWGAAKADNFIKQQEQDIKEGRYQPKYTKSFRQTVDEEGAMAGIGWAAEKVAENWATTGLALGSGLYAAAGLPLAAAVGGATLVGTGLLGAGEVRQELEEKGIYDEEDEATVLGVGALIGLIDKVSGGRGKPVKDALLKKFISTQTPKMLGKAIAKGAGKEIPAELAQEFLAVGTAYAQGADYEPSELLDRAIDVAVVSGTMGAGAGVGDVRWTRGVRGIDPEVEDEPGPGRQIGPELRNIKTANVGGRVMATQDEFYALGDTVDEAVNNLNVTANKDKTAATAIEAQDQENASVILAGEQVTFEGPNALEELNNIVSLHNNNENPVTIEPGMAIEKTAEGYAVTRGNISGAGTTPIAAINNYKKQKGQLQKLQIETIRPEEIADLPDIPLTKKGNIGPKTVKNALISNGFDVLTAPKNTSFKAYKDGIVYTVAIKKAPRSTAKTATVKATDLDGNPLRLPESITSQTIVDTEGNVVQQTIKLEQPMTGIRVDRVEKAGETLTNIAPDSVDDMANRVGAEVIEITPKIATVRKDDAEVTFFLDDNDNLVAKVGDELRRIPENTRLVDRTQPEALSFSAIPGAITDYNVIRSTKNNIFMRKENPDGSEEFININKEDGTLSITKADATGESIGEPQAVESINDLRQIVGAVEQAEIPYLAQTIEEQNQESIFDIFNEEGLQNRIAIIEGRPAIVVEGRPVVILDTEATAEAVQDSIDRAKIFTLKDNMAEPDAETDRGVLMEVPGEINFDKTGVLVETDLRAFLDLIPSHIRGIINIHTSIGAAERKLLGKDATGIFRPHSDLGPQIHVDANPDRTMRQVVETIAHEVSHFSFDSWNIPQFETMFNNVYDFLENTIKKNIPAYYEMYKIDPENPTVYEKSILVNEYFAHYGASMFDLDPNVPPQGLTSDDVSEIKNSVENTVAGVTFDMTKDSPLNEETATEFLENIFKAQMAPVIGRGVHIQFKQPDPTGIQTIHIRTTDYGTRTDVIPDTENAKRISRMKERLRKMPEGRSKDRLRFRMANWMTRETFVNTPIGRHNTAILASAMKAAGITEASKLTTQYGLAIQVNGILQDNGLSSADVNSHGGYVKTFQANNITGKRQLDLAEQADEFLKSAHNLKYKNVGEIRKGFRDTIDILRKFVPTNPGSEKLIGRWTNQINQTASRIISRWDHRLYSAYMEDGAKDLNYMMDKLTRAPDLERLMGEEAREARKAIATINRQAADGKISEREARKQRRKHDRILSLKDRMDALHDWARIKGAPNIQEAMQAKMREVLGESQGFSSMKAVSRLEVIPAMQRRKLDPNNSVDKLLMTFLDPVTDPLMVALHSLDQQNKVMNAVRFANDFGNNLLSDGIAWLQGTDRIGVKDIGLGREGSLLGFIEIHPEMAPFIERDVQINSAIADDIMNRTIGLIKQGLTIFNPRLAVSNYVSNVSALVMGGHLTRISKWGLASKVSTREFKNRLSFQVDNKADFAQTINDEMSKNYTFEGGVTSLQSTIFNNNVIRDAVKLTTQALNQYRLVGAEKKARIDTVTTNLLNRAKGFYGFGDEWVKTFVYLNHREIEIARAETLINRDDYATDQDYKQAILDIAVPRAADKTNRETTTWAVSPQLAKQLAGRHARIFFPDFIMHQLQWVKIQSENINIIREHIAERKQAIENGHKEYARTLTYDLTSRGLGHFATYGAWYALATSATALIPTITMMIGSVFDDETPEDEKPIKDRWLNVGKNVWSTQKLLNYMKYSGNNLYSPLWFRDGYKLYAYNDKRLHAALTWAVVRQASEDPELIDFLWQTVGQLTSIGNDTLVLQIKNLLDGKDQYGEPITWERAAKDVSELLVPEAVEQAHSLIFGNELFVEKDVSRWIEAAKLTGIQIKEFDVRDIASTVGFNISKANSSRTNAIKKDFYKTITSGRDLEPKEIASAINRMRKSTKQSYDQAMYAINALREEWGEGDNDKEIKKYIMKRRDGVTTTGASGAIVKDLLSGENGFDNSIIKGLKLKRQSLTKQTGEGRLTSEQLETAVKVVDRTIDEYEKVK